MTDTRPNVLFLLTDQERADLLAPEGLPVETPNLDRLRDEGTWFDRAYTPVGICTSARASLLTGLYPHAHGMLNNSHEADAIRTDLPEGMPTFGERLAEAGYENTYAGKWHVGQTRGPESFGFEYFGGSDDHHDDLDVRYKRYKESLDVEEETVEDAVYADDGEGGMLVSGTSSLPPEATRTYFLAELTIEAIERRAEGEEGEDADAPFFHRTDFLGPHHPYVVPEPYASMYDPEEIEPWPSYAETFEGKPRVHEQYTRYRGVDDFDWETWSELVANYFGFVTFIDDQVGRILDALAEYELDEETVVVHAADHGDFTGSHRQFNKGPLMYEQTYRIPLVVRDPTRETVDESDAFVRLHDLMPTFLDWGDAEVPDGLHARSLLPLLVGDDTDDWPDAVYAQYHGDEFGLYSQRMLRTERYKFVYNGPDTNELYDLREDPHELRNLADHPHYEDAKAELQEALVERMNEVDDPLRKWVPKSFR
ncbi:sulfatase-like hydrolase/transferase [Halogeometricum sp. S1BR25-6]|uniref:Sulfatase-like hydrolase/transferase n=1 Tax=Halogeometricum salsisoli TaxID=2950536 RepID=A0ABU2GGQ2_9EURY|nr:sulfatase-like hydrolase/transferase [Halogeometricum sp. S1BR25-6]MDS0299969.1 sulfatase-like hydrolase/transferase [Halogeometricum sp. S1BR25-6]